MHWVRQCCESGQIPTFLLDLDKKTISGSDLVVSLKLFNVLEIFTHMNHLGFILKRYGINNFFSGEDTNIYSYSDLQPNLQTFPQSEN